jgi:hypothetical protein
MEGWAKAILYDTINGGYATLPATEPRVAALLWAALGDAETVLNAGAGTGSYVLRNLLV